MGTDLPAGLDGETGDGHAKWCAPRTGCGALLEGMWLIIATSTTSELDDQAFAHEGGAICKSQCWTKLDRCAGAAEVGYIRKAMLRQYGTLK